MSAKAAESKIDAVDAKFKSEIRPVLESQCYDCHGSDSPEADVDLASIESIADARRDVQLWQRVREMVSSGQMPPKDYSELSHDERTQLLTWVTTFLKAEAKAHAGDPGPVVLRRLTNAEYTYTIRDLTGVDSLDPAAEFPVDGAAGEGFTNVGAALVVSSGTFAKYFDAAKEVASHAVLLPDGIEFFEKTRRREWAQEILADIRQMYTVYSMPGVEVPPPVGQVDGQSRMIGGVIPLEKYIRVTLAERKTLSQGADAINEVAQRHNLSPKYLGILWNKLNSDSPSLLLDVFRNRWRNASPDEAGSIVDQVAGWQNSLWHFTRVGQIGKRHGPPAWQVPVIPVATKHDVHLAFPDDIQQETVTLYLNAGDASDGAEQDEVVWQDARLQLTSGMAIPLARMDAVVAEIKEAQQAELSRTIDYLQAVAEAERAGRPIQELAAENDLNGQIAADWQAFLQLELAKAANRFTHFASPITNYGGHASLRGWGAVQTPFVIANSGEKDIDSSGSAIPAKSVVMHPSSDQNVAIYWKSPIEGVVQLSGKVKDANGNGGNGIAYEIERISHSGNGPLDQNTIPNAGYLEFAAHHELAISKGDVIAVTVESNGGDHSCDTTQLELIIKQVGDQDRVWNLADDVAATVERNNPHPDGYGNPDVWHFCLVDTTTTDKPAILDGTDLAQWTDAFIRGASQKELSALANRVQEQLTRETSAAAGPNDTLKAKILSGQGPIRWLNSTGVGESIHQTAPSILAFEIPADFARGAEFHATAVLDRTTGREGTVQVQASLAKPGGPLPLTPGHLVPLPVAVGGSWTAGVPPYASGLPVLVTAGSKSEQRLRDSFQEFQNLFPSALCYTKIVPVDEIVTMVLFYREDEHYKQLMLDGQQAKKLDKLWDEFHFVSQDALQLVDVFEQVWQYATQDADPTQFEPMREPIKRQAEALRRKMKQTEPTHVQAVLEIAEQAWRRPLTVDEQHSLRGLYAQLRSEELEHEEAVRMTLARVLISPDFLYKVEKPNSDGATSPVSGHELASRLSYFLTSSTPDAELLSVVEKLTDDEMLSQQTNRMLEGPQVRRLAIHFACQWLHVRDFDENDEKNEQLYPEFGELRDDMYEETVLFFEDMFRNNGSILDVLNADHTFLNPALAAHYGIDLPSEDEAQASLQEVDVAATRDGWRRVEGVRARQRGGVLGMATVLASQSGASRTSPILRGNWVYETLLGERLPRPPANVPLLPEEVPEGLTARQLIERHSSDPACAKCHKQIDPYGFSLENFDAIGRLRTEDVDTQSVLVDGMQIDGIVGLREYLSTTRRDQVVRHFCRKLLGYALGREVRLSDEPLLDDMMSALKDNDYRFQTAVEVIVTSPQFKTIRGVDTTTVAKRMEHN